MTSPAGADAANPISVKETGKQMRFENSPETDLTPTDEVFDVIAASAAKGPVPARSPERPRPSILLGRIVINILRRLDPRHGRHDGSLIRLAIAALLAGPIVAILTRMAGHLDPTRAAMIFAGAGVVMGAALFWHSIISKRDALYSGAHLFMFLGAILAFAGVIDRASLALVTGPALLGYGLGSWIAMIASIFLRQPEKPGADSR